MLARSLVVSVLLGLHAACLDTSSKLQAPPSAISAALDAEHCSAARIDACDNFACGCVDNECSGGYCPNVADACSDGRREGCLNQYGCGCANETCTGLFCANPPLPGALLTEPGFDIDAERAAILAGVSGPVALGSGAAAGLIGMFDRRAFPIVMGADHAVVAASLTYSGRAVAFGHPDFLARAGVAHASTKELLRSAARWTAHGKAEPAVGVIGAADGVTTAIGTSARALEGPITESSLAGLDAVALLGDAPLGPSELDALVQFNLNGGGLLVAGLGWAWLGYHPEPLRDMPGNVLLARVGLGFIDGYGGGDTFAPQANPSMITNAVHAFNWLRESGPADTKEELAELRRVEENVRRVFPLLTRPSPLLVSLKQLLEATTVGYPSWENPVAVGARPFLNLGYRYLAERIVVPQELAAHRAAADFPGAVPRDAQRVERTITVDTRVPNWHSTALYAAAGDVIRVRVPESATAARLQVRIGPHNDSLLDFFGAKDELIRMPQISRAFPLNQTEVAAANEFGGLIYIDVPDGATAGTVNVTIANAVEAPYYELGVTSDASWNDSIRRRPAPFGELATGNVVFTVPSSYLRELASPSAILSRWQDAIRIQDEFAQWPPDRRKRPDRAVFDRQIGYGYMHAGYPVMAPMGERAERERVVRESFDPTSFTGSPRRLWGLFHEFGHEHQNYDWTFEGTGEVTNNLWTMVTIERATGHPKEVGIIDVTPQGQLQNICQYFYFLYPDEGLIKDEKIAPMTFEHWKARPFIGLQMYIQLMDRLAATSGEDPWAPYERVARDYIEHPLGEVDDATKRDQWLIRMSRAAGVDLSAYFDTWKIPVSGAARDEVDDLEPFEWQPPPRESCPARWVDDF